MTRFLAFSLGVVALVAGVTAAIVLSGRRSFPSSASIVFELGARNYNLYAITPNGSFGERMHTLFMPERTFDDRYVTGVDCAPDSRSLIFWYIFLYRFDLQSEELTQLIVGQGLSQQSVWSPDGSRIAYLDDAQTGRPREIFTVQPDGSAKTQVTGNPFQETSLSWSPDGAQIAFSYKRLDDPAQQGIGIADVTTGVSTVLYESQRPVSDVSWSPDGRRIAFDAADGRAVHIYTIDSTGANLSRLTQGSGQNILPRWSPDGALISYSARAGSPHYALYVMDADGGNPYLVFYDARDDDVFNRCWLAG